ncbi:hypothetical protein J2X76_003630 [Neorhizobium sp. 2083]|uniref:hypothetical protein n=1 Tax=Neorhizobium sp. 2083 TaxID=2817762 RepID=UPI002860BB73|nr:hypothetical protein [Neorhizobium sp. 2083]MDR6818453.1 hypothetical protein [Neorhizobium sp. 2083]
MAYFSNGTEGMMYEEKFCDRCLHQEGCPVWDAHLLYSYRDCNDEGSILHMLIPRDGAGNARCRMFVDKGLLSNLALLQYRAEAQKAEVAHG